MVQDSGRLPSGGTSSGSLPTDLLDSIQAALASGGGAGQTAANTNIVPLWKARPAPLMERINPGQFDGDSFREGPRRVTLDLNAGGREAHTAEYAASSFLDMSEEDRVQFERLAIASGLLKPGNNDPDALASAWQRAVGYTANYNQDRTEDKWISPWEAVTRLGAQNAAREGGSYDPFKPRTIHQSQTIKRDFTKGQDAEGVTRTLESLFNSEMGRAPTEAERKIYQQLVQKAYDASPEKNSSTTTTDFEGNSTTSSVQSGGIDQTATLLDQVREDPEQQAFAAGSTYFSAAMQALGAIA